MRSKNIPRTMREEVLVIPLDHSWAEPDESVSGRFDCPMSVAACGQQQKASTRARAWRPCCLGPAPLHNGLI